MICSIPIINRTRQSSGARFLPRLCLRWGDSRPCAPIVAKPRNKVDAVDTVDVVDATQIDTGRGLRGSFYGFGRAGVSDPEIIPASQFENCVDDVDGPPRQLTITFATFSIHGSFWRFSYAGISDGDTYLAADQLRSLKRLKPKPKVCGLKLWGRGAVRSPAHRFAQTCGPLIQGFFFGAAEFWGSLSLTQSKFVRSFNASSRSLAGRTRIYFPSHPGGVVRSSRGRCRGPVANDANFFASFRNIFFWARGGSEVWTSSIADRRPGTKSRPHYSAKTFFSRAPWHQKIVAKFGVGGGSIDRRDI